MWLLGLLAPTTAEMSPTVITWREHKPSVEENKDLIHRVNVEVAALDAVAGRYLSGWFQRGHR